MAELDARRTEVLSNAAKAIQRRIRTHNAHKQFIALRKAAIDIQSLWRGEPSENSKAWVDFVTSCTAIFIYYVFKPNCSFYKENDYFIGFYPLLLFHFLFPSYCLVAQHDRYMFTARHFNSWFLFSLVLGMTFS